MGYFGHTPSAKSFENMPSTFVDETPHFLANRIKLNNLGFNRNQAKQTLI